MMHANAKRRRQRAAVITTMAAILCVTMPGARAEQSNEDRLRDALRQSVTEMRAAQDQAAQAQADLQKAQQAQQGLQAQLDAANAKLTTLQGAAKPEESAAMKADLASARAQNADLQSALAKWQAASEAATAAARAKTTENERTAAFLKANTAALNTCKAANGKLIMTSEEILNLYDNGSFRSLLFRSHEPVTGFARVKLENIIQDYDDKIHSQEYVAPPEAGAK